MRAAVLHGDAGGGDLRLEEVETPRIGPGEVLVRVVATGICGSDVHFVFDGTARPSYTPIILGHETMGVVEALGRGVTGPPVGTRVSVVPLVTCANCPRCLGHRTVICARRECLGAEREGTLAEFVVVPGRNVIPVPDGLADELAAVATDSVGTAYHAVATRGRVGAGDRVAVFGTGGLGLSAIGIARALGAATVIGVDPRDEARKWTLETGADLALHPDEAMDRIRDIGGVDAAFEFVGRQETAEKAVRSLDHGGRAVVVGVGHEHLSAGRMMTFVMRERAVFGAYGNEPEEISKVLDLLATGRLVLPRVVGDVVPLTAVVEAVERVRDGNTGGSRIVVDVAR